MFRKSIGKGQFMKWIVNMKIKDYVHNWSNQEIETEYKGVRADIKIKDYHSVVPGNFSKKNQII